TETDPMFNASVASGITATDTANWNNKQDQLVAGTNITIVGDTISATGGSTLTIGQAYQGGIIFWLDSTGQHGLIAAIADQDTGVQWYNGTFAITNAVRDGVYSGQYNTERIIANQGAGNYAAQICANYQGGGYGDWYLPSKYELNLLYLQRATVGGFTNSVVYWTSNEYDSNHALGQLFGYGYQDPSSKVSMGYVRAIRAF
ncbi:MAG: DUF1566 domain-containing protein, partial [Bacteroidales bacterium]|nr:DUF1566 domain-containing protein [Bacteroidales bacterium]